MLAAALLVFYGWGTYHVCRAPYAPVGSDEYHYLLEAKSAYYNGAWHTPFTFWERVARVGDFGFHGFLYNALHGTVARLLGYRPLWIVLTNVALLACALMVLLLSGTMPLPRALLACASILICFAVPVYTFTFMQENIHVLIAIVAWVLLYKMAAQRAGEHAWTYGYYALIAAATLLRPQWALWAVAPLPLARSVCEGVLYLLLAIAAPLYAYVSMYVFCAAYPLHNWFFQEALDILRTRGIAALLPAAWARFSRNVHQYFIAYRIGFADFWVKYVFVGLLAYVIVAAWRYRQRVMAAVALTALVNLLVLWGAFDAMWWTDHRMLCASFVLMLLAVGAYGHAGARWAVLLALLILLPDTLKVTREHIAERHRLGQLTKQWHERVAALEALSQVITNQEMTTVLVSSKLYQHYDVVLPALPVRNGAGFPIRYTVNLYHPNDLQRFGLLNVQYALVAEPVEGNEYELVRQTPYYYLYRFRNAVVEKRKELSGNKVRNGDFREGLQHWSVMGEKGNIRVVRGGGWGEPQTWLRIENPKAQIIGVRQDVAVVSGAVYRLSGRVRSCAGHAPVLFGARVCWEARPLPPHQLIWMTEYNHWWEKDLVITSDVGGIIQIEATMGYGGVPSTGEFTDIRLVLVGMAETKTNSFE
ncbi:MAG: hypothetical protein N2595_02815 [bacterium]|nr:hypothetical protein [bacterium]